MPIRSKAQGPHAMEQFIDPLTQRRPLLWHY